tara:strand:+ start:1361 stop:2263 length:903 start_codon:yes stop_codon:yes gene_type:complete
MLKFHKMVAEKTIHPTLVLPDKKCNLILYGPPGSGKYYQALYYLKQFSPTQLKYESKVLIPYNKDNLLYRISDIHIEIDIELLGCQAKSLWNTIYKYINNMTFLHNELFILCKNFHLINDDLYDIFDCYMQKNYYKETKIHYILITQTVSNIHDRILNKCSILNIPRPQKTPLQQNMKVKYKEYTHLIELKHETIIYGKHTIAALCEIIIHKQTTIQTIRNKLYDLLKYNIPLWDFIHVMIQRLNESKLLTSDNCLEVYALIYKTIKLHNNNYREIFHLESLVVNLIILIHGKEACMQDT